METLVLDIVGNRSVGRQCTWTHPSETMRNSENLHNGKHFLGASGFTMVAIRTVRARAIVLEEVQHVLYAERLMVAASAVPKMRWIRIKLVLQLVHIIPHNIP